MMFVLKYSYSYTFIKFGVRCSHFFCGYFRIVRLWKFLALMLDEKNNTKKNNNLLLKLVDTIMNFIIKEKYRIR